MASSPHGQQGSKRLVFVCAVLGVAAAMSILGLHATTTIQPDLSPVATHRPLTDPWSSDWSKMPTVTVQTSAVLFRSPRLVTLWAASRAGHLYVTAEWRDETPDMGYEGAFYPSRREQPSDKVQQSVLLRDELTVWLGCEGAGKSRDRFANRWHENGTWTWRSQWQHDKDLGAMHKVRKVNGEPYVDYYPMVGDGAYAARFVSNSNAVTDSSATCKWIMESAKSVYDQPTTRDIGGSGKWKDGRWRVTFDVPQFELDACGDHLDLVLAIVDGGLSERRSDASLSQLVRLDLRGLRANDGGDTQ